jgi:hypothetical protein
MAYEIKLAELNLMRMQMQRLEMVDKIDLTDVVTGAESLIDVQKWVQVC